MNTNDDKDINPIWIVIVVVLFSIFALFATIKRVSDVENKYKTAILNCKAIYGKQNELSYYRCNKDIVKLIND